MKKLAKAIALAAWAHEDQMDKSGKPYVLHTLEVMNILIRQGVEDEDTLCVAVLHDILEDTTYPRDYMIKDYGWIVTRAVQRLTKRKGETYEDYLERVALGKDSLMVKMADLEHNSDIRRIKGLTEKDLQRTIKYQKAYEFLKSKLKEM